MSFTLKNEGRKKFYCIWQCVMNSSKSCKSHIKFLISAKDVCEREVKVTNENWFLHHSLACKLIYLIIPINNNFRDINNFLEKCMKPVKIFFIIILISSLLIKNYSKEKNYFIWGKLNKFVSCVSQNIFMEFKFLNFLMCLWFMIQLTI